MRTTLTLDEDVSTRLRRLARARGATFKEIVNAILRAGLSRQDARGRAGPYRLRTFRSPFRPGVDPLRLNALNDALAAEEDAADGRG